MNERREVHRRADAEDRWMLGTALAICVAAGIAACGADHTPDPENPRHPPGPPLPQGTAYPAELHGEKVPVESTPTASGENQRTPPPETSSPTDPKP